MHDDGELRTPRPGDIALCGSCNGISIFDGADMRDPTGDELHYILTNPRIQKALARKAEVAQLFEKLKKKPSRGGA
jgi:hypothetical protein